MKDIFSKIRELELSGYIKIRDMDFFLLELSVVVGKAVEARRVRGASDYRQGKLDLLKRLREVASDDPYLCVSRVYLDSLL